MWSQFSPTFRQVLGLRQDSQASMSPSTWGRLIGPLLSLSIQSGSPVRGIVPPTFRVNFAFLVESFWKYPHSEPEVCSHSESKPVKLIMMINHHTSILCLHGTQEHLY